MTQFSELGLAPNLLNAITAMGYTEATPIQAKAIPEILKGRDLMGLAQTGTGKTAAFGLPLVQRLMPLPDRPAPKTVRALILAPTRELTTQIYENLRAMTKNSHLRINIVIGGVGLQRQAQNLSRGTDILVATPGRLIDLLERRDVRLDAADYLVLDEADQMLDMGFIHALRRIAKLLPEKRQTLLFSATMPKLMAELAQTYLKDPVRVQVSPPGKAADKVRQVVHFVSQKNKYTLLRELLSQNPDDLSLVFSRTKHGAEKMMKLLVSHDFKAISIHGNKSQNQRDRAIAGFKSGEYRILVATDVAARGIDIPGVSHVYNYDLPEVAENYVHRIGRTARAGEAGEAVAFCAPTENKLLREIEKLMKIEIETASGVMQPDEDAPKQQRGGGGRRGQGQGQGRPAGVSSLSKPKSRQGAPRRRKTA